MPRQKAVGTCPAEDCGRPVECKGLCGKHYRMRLLYGRTEKKYRGDKRAHPLYSIWFERKQRGSLCPDWVENFDAFTEAVGDRPSPTHLLRKLRGGEPYGPDNFEWMAALRQLPGETKKDFNARKWASRRERQPEYEGHRNLRRKYGVTPEMYAEMLAAQGRVCRICSQPETRLHPKTAAPQQLAVDHCHTTKKVRGLLCWRCNTMLGKVDDSAELLQKMIDYLTGA